jgi:hypothetical protein
LVHASIYAKQKNIADSLVRDKYINPKHQNSFRLPHSKKLLIKLAQLSVLNDSVNA